MSVAGAGGQSPVVSTTTPASTGPLTTSSPSATRGTSPPRILALDVVRGVAVAGILFVNAPPLLDTAGGFVDGHPTPVREFLDMAVQQRFFPIFSLLFGIGFGLMWDAAVGRAQRPRVVMLRRLLLLLLLGVGREVLQPGEALLPYAIFGLVLLLPATFLPDTKGANGALLALGLVGVASAAAIGGGAILVPALLVTGWAVARLGLVGRFTGSHSAPVMGAVVFTVLSVPALWWQAQDPINAGFNASSAAAGLVMAAAYACIVCAMLPTRAGQAIARFFAPLGRTA
ncbi:MAG: DUF418 domain-containing protein, partial [Actinomycetes bacterium]